MSDIIPQYMQLKKDVLDNFFSRMNPMQRQAVFTVDGPLLILAGAGSGKTTVLINRILNMVRFGDGYSSAQLPAGLCEEDILFLQSCLSGECPDEGRMFSLLSHGAIKPWNILAITFTNKAAGELRERLSKSLGEMAADINAATFHSACMRILRVNIEKLGYAKNFTIYDSDDSIRVIKKLLDVQKLGDKNIKPRSILNAISHAKDKMLTPQELLESAGGDFLSQLAAKVYVGYQQELKAANALDFDDIILLTVRLFEQFPEVLAHYQNRYRYIMVDEYQDTNALQYRLISLLSSAHKNLCVVGDDDQSIYKFRGATIENILRFEDQFPGAVVVRLEQNYRSTKTILEAANGVIKNNTARKGKNLWTENESGAKVLVRRLSDEQREAAYICESIGANVRQGQKFSDHAVLYRMNAQSNALEREMTRNAIPYHIVGGLRFYERKEIKDVVAYLSVINNPSDNLRLARIINEPKRGIGDATIAAAMELAASSGLPLFDILCHADEYAPISRRAVSLLSFSRMLLSFIEDAQNGSPLDTLLDRVLEESGYLPALIAQGESEQTRVENIGELKTNIQHYMQESEEPTLSGFLEEIALYIDLDSYNDSDDRVVLMTVHSAKGLEFANVFVSGAEEGIFPGNQSIYNPEEVEEERRLAYVAYTRARKSLIITCCAQRTLFGSTMRNQPSRFVREIPVELAELVDTTIISHLSAASRNAKTAAVTHNGGKLSANTVKRVSSEAGGIPLSIGDRVEHSVYGSGILLNVRPMGGDRLLEIAFDSVGTKKVMSNYAKIKKL